MLVRLEPLQSGRDTEIDMIEREMEGGVVVIQPLDVHEHYSDKRLGGLLGVEEDIEVQQLGAYTFGGTQRVRSCPTRALLSTMICPVCMPKCSTTW